MMLRIGGLAVRFRGLFVPPTSDNLTTTLERRLHLVDTKQNCATLLLKPLEDGMTKINIGNAVAIRKFRTETAAKVAVPNEEQKLSVKEQKKLARRIHAKYDVLLCAPHKLLELIPAHLENRILVLKEIGLQYKDCSNITRFAEIMKKSIYELKSSEGFVTPESIRRSFVDILYEVIKPGRSLDVSTENILQLSFREIRKQVIVQLLQVAFRCTEKQAASIVRRNNNIILCNFSWLTSNLITFRKTFGLTTSKFSKYAYLLAKPPEHYDDILRLRSLATKPPIYSVQVCPRVLENNAKTLRQIDRIVRQLPCYPKSFLKYPEVYSLELQQVEENLKAIQNDLEIKIYDTNVRFAQLIYFYPSAKERLTELKSLGLCTSISLNSLLCGKPVYRKLLETKYTSRGRDTIVYLQQHFHRSSTSDIRSKLKYLGSMWKQCRLLNIVQVLGFLEEEMQISLPIIFDALPIVFYPVDEVKTACQQALDTGAANVQDAFFVHMLLYKIEKPNDFKRYTALCCNSQIDKNTSGNESEGD